MIEATIALIWASALLLGSPGPAPLALAATGAAYGIRDGFPFLIGILSGLFVAMLGATIGLGALFSALPSARITVQIIGGVYICFIAIKIAMAPVIHTDAPPLKDTQKLVDGFVLNLLNPKAYAAFLAIFSQFLLPVPNTFWAFVTTGVVCLFVAAVVDFVWLYFGGIIGPLFKKPRQARIVRIIFAILIWAAVLWTFSR